MGDRNNSNEFTVHVRNLGVEISEGDLADIFHDCKVERAHLVRDRETNKSRGFGYVSFADEESFKKALELDGASLHDRQLEISVATPRGGSGRRGPSSHSNSHSHSSSSSNFNRSSHNKHHNNGPQVFPTEPPFTAYMGNLSFGRTEDDLRNLCEGLSVKDVRIIRDRATGESRGHGYVDFADGASLQESLKLNGYEWDGRVMRVDVAQAKKKEYGTGFSVPADDSQRKRLVLKPRSIPIEATPRVAEPSSRKKNDPFGGAKPRDEFAYQRKKQIEKGKGGKNTKENVKKEAASVNK